MREMKASIAAILAILAAPASAYVGPGLGAGTLGVILGLIGSVFLAILAVVWFPMKRLIKRRQQNNRKSNAAQNNQINENAGEEEDRPAR